MANSDITPATNSSYGAIENTARGLISGLWDRAADKLTNEELADVVRISEYATIQARNLSDIIADVGCLIGSDTQAGNFRDRGSVSTLLFSIAHQVDTIAGMLEVSADAEFRLAHPEIYKPKAA